ncbi:hypothetical protein QZH41_013413, partial [Actinostola sp. cb2023]
NVITKQWIGVQPTDKTEIRNFLYQYLLSHHKSLPVFVRNKLVKVIVDVGRIDWPHFYHNFFSNILEHSGKLRLYDCIKSNHDLLTAGILAMCCINELLAKNCVPAEFEEFLLKLFQQTFHLLQRITKESSVIDSDLSELDESYLDKFTEFLSMFVHVHLRRFENSSHFPVIELLTLLFKYTFKQPNNEGLFSCLDIWAVFLDYLIAKVSNARSDKLAEAEATVSRYKEVLMLLLNELLKKIQFAHNQAFLDDLDDQSVDADVRTIF